MDSKIDSMVQTLQGICIQDNPDQTAKQLKKHTQTMLNTKNLNLGFAKEKLRILLPCKPFHKVIHKRLDGPGGYNRKWTECENGYGDINNEFWFGDKLTYHNGMKFSTVDQDNDPHSSYNCAKSHEGAWWYKSCSNCDLSRNHGKSLKPYWGSVQDLVESVMMIRKT
ncbi:unnamed protein product [Mytilus edulis]|uniref:Fibrinogen C-terminal domain-containing protein n=1 Tax=Mytilus edulis TaxID=6550 RepID=A0A8S3UA70_MYTED|nr:unnamed protein product [Mytilus edulis]